MFLERLNYFANRTLLPGLLVAILFVAGCANSTIFRKTDLAGYNLLSLDAKQRLVISGVRPDGRRVICAEPSPDAIVAQASYLAASATRDAANTALGAGQSESAASIGIRTQTIQLLRDGYFRICEAYLNGAIDDDVYLQVICHIDTFMVALVAIQAIGGVVAAPTVAISGGTFNTNATAGGTDGAGTDGDGTNAQPGTTFGTITANTTGLNKDQAEAINKIVFEYEQRREQQGRASKNNVCAGRGLIAKGW